MTSSPASQPTGGARLVGKHRVEGSDRAHPQESLIDRRIYGERASCVPATPRRGPTVASDLIEHCISGICAGGLDHSPEPAMNRRAQRHQPAWLVSILARLPARRSPILELEATERRSPRPDGASLAERTQFSEEKVLRDRIRPSVPQCVPDHLGTPDRDTPIFEPHRVESGSVSAKTRS
jgi:hypothetical protein